MKTAPAFFQYRPGTTLIHRLPAKIKLPLFILLSFLIFASPIQYLGLITVLLIILSLTAQISAKTVLNNARLLFWYTLMICAFRFIGKPPVSDVLLPLAHLTLLYIWQLGLILSAGSLFYETTSTLEIRQTLSDFQSLIVKKFNTLFRFIFREKKKIPEYPDIAFLLSLTITFIPRIFESWTHLNRAWDARGGNSKGGLRPAWRRFTVLVPALFITLFSLAVDTDRAIRNRS